METNAIISREQYARLQDNQKKWRQALHQIPEIRLECPQTAAFCKDIVRQHGFEVIEPEGVGSSFVAFLDLGFEDTLAFRSDMDALPVLEQSGCAFASKHPGFMHACGHDGHMSALLGFASIVEQFKDRLTCNVALVFQAGEESPGGAQLLCQSGIFKQLNVRGFFGMHLWPELEAGVLATRPGAMMAMTTEVDVTFRGKSAHAARYWEGSDAMQAACQFLTQADVMEKSMPADIWRLLHFGKLKAGSVRNAVADSALLEGTLRTFSMDIYEQMLSSLHAIASEIEANTGVRIEIESKNGYPSVWNDEALAQAVIGQFPRVQSLDKAQMIAEDFSFYQQQAPGVFFFLGTGTGIPLHSSHFDFDEAILADASLLYAELALNFDTLFGKGSSAQAN